MTYDDLVIGAGMGGLTVAALLAKEGLDRLAGEGAPCNSSGWHATSRSLRRCDGIRACSQSCAWHIGCSFVSRTTEVFAMCSPRTHAMDRRARILVSVAVATFAASTARAERGDGSHDVTGVRGTARFRIHCCRNHES